jgi:hypothetical protein
MFAGPPSGRGMEKLRRGSGGVDDRSTGQEGDTHDCRCGARVGHAQNRPGDERHDREDSQDRDVVGRVQDPSWNPVGGQARRSDDDCQDRTADEAGQQADGDQFGFGQRDGQQSGEWNSTE